MWQDIALMITGFVFAPALLVSIIRKTKYPLLTSLPTALALTVITFTFTTLNLYLAAISVGLTTVCWYILVFRR